MIATPHLRAFAGLACLLGLATASPSIAGDAKPEAYEPKARQLLDEVVKTYKALPAYADRGELSILARSGADQKKGTSKRNLTFARPNKLDLDFGVVRLVSDGKNLTAAVLPTKTYAVSPAPESVVARSLAQAPIPGVAAPQLFGGVDSLPVMILLDLLDGEDAAKSILEGTDGLKLEADRERDGRKVKSLFVDQSQGPDIRMLVDPATKMLAAIDLVFNLGEMNAQLNGGGKLDELSIGWAPGETKRQAPEGAFAYAPPEDFKKVDPKDAGAPQGAGVERSAVDELVGKPAPDFTLTVLDGQGKTKKVTKADLAGKVVLLDFWATWCGPCLQELPEIQKLVDAYAGKEVVVVAVSQDEDPGDPKELRKLVEETLGAKKIKLAESPIGKVALDPEHEVGGPFKVEALPTVVLLDAKGVVQSAHLGYSPNVRQILSKEIDTLLEGKALVEPKADGDAPRE